MSKLATAILRAQLKFFKPIITRFDIKTANEAQDRLGMLIAHIHSAKADFINYDFDKFKACIALPKKLKNNATVLYLHGGGYTAGQLRYAAGFGSVLAVKLGMKTVFPAYRLAPDDPFPAALDDVIATYESLLNDGELPHNIFLCGESAGGGLAYALVLALKQRGISLPNSIIAISPWCDLTMQGDSYAFNRRKDPTLLQSRLDFYARLYAGDDLTNPLVSPLFGALDNMPPSLLFAGGHEILLSSVIKLNEALKKAGNDTTLIIEDKMWHVYPLYGTDESKRALDRIQDFIDEKRTAATMA